MRWPLKHQLSLRIILLIFASIFALTYANIQSSVSAARDTEIEQVRKIANTIEQARFPMTTNVLANMKALSGADFVVADMAGVVAESTCQSPKNFKAAASDTDAPIAIDFNQKTFYQATVVKRSGRDNQPKQIHVLVPRQSETKIFWKASRSPLMVAAVVFPIAILIAYATASGITKPISSICAQSDRLSQGKPLELSERFGKRNDEVGDLVRTMNGISTTIKQHERQVIAN